MRRSGARLGAVVCCGSLLSGCAPAPERPPNVLLIVLDTARADATSVARPGAVTTPLGRLARDGVVFTKARSTSAWTVPAHGSLFTGLYSSRHGAHHESQHLRPDNPTLAELLTYSHDTAGFSENPHIGEQNGFARGFQHFDETWRGRRTLDQVLPTVERAVAWLRRRDRERPFLLFVNLIDSHLPYQPPPHVARSFVAADADPERVARLRGFTEREARGFIAGRLPLSPADLSLLRALYEADVAFSEMRLGPLVEELERQRELDRTLVVVVGDHGENIGEHGLMEHQLCLYETLLRIPMVVRLPGMFDGGGRDDAAVQLTDVLPTVLQAVGLERSRWPPMEGRSLLEAALAERPIIAEYMRPQEQRLGFELAEPGFDFDRFDRRLRSLQRGRLKLIRSDRGELELYDLERDPGETRDLAGQPDYAADLERLAAELDAWSLSHAVTGGPRPQLDEETASALRALGYLP